MHPYGEKKPGGLPRIIFGWAESLMQNDRENEYVIFLKEKPEQEPDLPGKNWHTEILGTGRLWLTRLKYATPCDVYLFNTPVLPLFFKPRRSVIIALDYPYKYLAPRNFSERLKRILIGWYHGYSMHRADQIIAVSNSTKNDTVRFFDIPAEKISVVYHGYKKICEVLERAPSLPLPQKYFFFAGTLKERKNVLRIVQAFNLCVKANTDFVHDLVIGGKSEGEYYATLKKYIDKERIEDRVHFLGHLNEPELSYVYKRAEALVFPSIVEGTGFPILEALSCGIPAITSNIFGPAELGGNGAAVLVDPYHAEEIAGAMERLTTDEIFRRGIVTKGPAQLQRFSWDTCGKETLEILTRVARTPIRKRKSITMDFRIRFLTWFLTCISFFFAPFVFSKIRSGRRKRKGPQRFFIMPQLTRIGDIVCTTPVFHTIKKTYPDSFIAVLVSRKAGGVLAGNPYIDELIVLEDYKFHLFRFVRMLQKKSFDVGLSFSGTAFSSSLFFWSFIPTRIKLVYFPRFLAERTTDWLNNVPVLYEHHTFAPAFYLEMLKYAGIQSIYPAKEVYMKPETKEQIRVFLEEQGVRPTDVIIGISITAGNKIKEWGDARFGEVGKQLVERHGGKIVWIGGAKDRSRIEALVATLPNSGEQHSIATHFTLEELSALIKSLTLYIAVDTGPVYIAHALGVPVVDITGPVDPWEQPPHDEKSVCVMPPAPFYPSSFVFKGRGEDEEHKKALNAITVLEVVGAADYLLARRNKN